MDKRIETVIKLDGLDMYKFGHIELDITEEELRKVFNFGDILKVTISNIGSFKMPFFYYYDDVNIGELVLCTYTKGSYAVIARNYRAFGCEIGLLTSDTINGNYKLIHNSKKIGVTIELEEKNKSTILNIKSKEKKTYDFREIISPNIKNNTIYRSSSPIDDRLSDSKLVDKKVKELNIKSIINLANTKKEASEFTDFNLTYSSTCKTAYLNMPLDITSNTFKNKIKLGIEFISNNEPPFLIFCSEGRDRTGLFVSILEAYLGFDIKKILFNYIYSFNLLYDNKLNCDHISNIEDSIRKNLCTILDVTNLNQESLCKDTQKFLLKTGLEYETLLKFREKLLK